MGRALTLLAIVSLASTANAQNEAQLHMLNTGINLGWISGILQSQELTPANRTEITTDLGNAGAALTALIPLVPSPPYETSGFTAAIGRITNLAERMGTTSREDALLRLRSIESAVRGSLRVFLSARTGRRQVDTTCDSSIFDVGFYFGQGHTALQRGNRTLERRARASMQGAIRSGEGAARRLACPFPGATYRGGLGRNPTPTIYAAALPRFQNATGGTTTTPGAGTTASASGMTRAGRPNLDCEWRSSYGAIHWREGYYGSRSKTLQGSLTNESGVWVYRGVWGRANSSRSGNVVFRFETPTTFTGYWTEGSGRQTRWTGSSTCN